MDIDTNTNSAGESQFSLHRTAERVQRCGSEIVTSAPLPRSSYRGPRPHRRSKAISLETLQGLLRGEASIYVSQVDRQLPLISDRLLKLAWLASELAGRLEGRA